LATAVHIIKTAFGKTKALIIGAGSGLSRTRCAREAAGLPYDNADTFNTLFPGYHDRYGLKTISEIKIEISSDVFAGSAEGLFG
jgi:hypothetical protein